MTAFTVERIDQGNNCAGGYFTAPVDGSYLLQTSLRLDDVDSAASYYYIAIVTTAQTYWHLWTPTQFNADLTYWAAACSVVADMEASDQAYIVVFQATGTVQTDVEATAISWFSGCLLV